MKRRRFKPKDRVLVRATNEPGTVREWNQHYEGYVVRLDSGHSTFADEDNLVLEPLMPRILDTLFPQPRVAKKFVQFALHLLIEHHAVNNPYIDDYPTARHMAAAHRKECVICQYIDTHRRYFHKLTAGISESR